MVSFCLVGHIYFSTCEQDFPFQIDKVPANDVEALKSSMMGLFEKRRARKFFIYVQDYEESDPKSHEGLDLNKVTARELISYVAHFHFSLR